MKTTINNNSYAAVNMPGKALGRRCFTLVTGLFFSSFGVALTKQGALGISPVSSVAYICNLRFTQISLGSWLIAWNCLLILGQILVLRKHFSPVQLLQLPLSLLFGSFTDLSVMIVSVLPNSLYLSRLCLVFAGIVLCGLGSALAVSADLIMNSGEAFVKAVTQVCPISFGTVKIIFDVFAPHTLTFSFNHSIK